MFAIETFHVTKDYASVRALKEVSLQVPENVTLGLVGPNGAGKTTLFSLICGFLKPSSGSIHINGNPIKNGIHRGMISVLPQDARFMKYITIRDQFIWYAELLGLSADSARKDAERVLKLVDLYDAGGKEGDQLSHGMHKRMGIAQAFLGSPKIILLDEPTAGLDPKNAKEIRDTIRMMHQKVTFIVSSHNLAEIEDICDYIAILNKGTLVTQQPISSFTNQQSMLSFTVTEPVSPQVLEELAALDFIANVTFLEKPKHLQIELKATSKEMDNLIPKVIQALSSAQVLFIGMTKGSKLEDKFFDVIEANDGSGKNKK